MENKENKKETILKAAERLFSRKGFEGTTVDEIADKADVNKALIYYYFENKSDIMEQLINNFVTRSTDYSAELLSELESNEALDSEEQLSELIKEIISFFRKDEDLLRIVLMESLKPGKTPFIRRTLEFYDTHKAQKMLEKAKDKGTTINDDTSQMMVTEFFTGSVPLMLYTLYRDKWANYLDISRDKLDLMFINAFTRTHVQHHKSNEGNFKNMNSNEEEE